MADDSESQLPCLLRLPADVLRQIWHLLAPLGRVASQHALRCTCTHLRDVSTPWISSASLELGPGRDRAAAQLSCFPQHACLRKLSWKYHEWWPYCCSEGESDDEDEEWEGHASYGNQAWRSHSSCSDDDEHGDDEDNWSGDRDRGYCSTWWGRGHQDRRWRHVARSSDALDMFLYQESDRFSNLHSVTISGQVGGSYGAGMRKPQQCPDLPDAFESC